MTADVDPKEDGTRRVPLFRRFLWRVWAPPEFWRLPSDEHRDAVARSLASSRILSMRDAVLQGVIVAMLFLGLLWVFRHQALAFWATSTPFGRLLALLPVAGVTVWASSLVSGRRYDRKVCERVRLEMNRLGLPTCVQCGYDLRGIESTRCPECGAERRNTPEARMPDGKLNGEETTRH